MATKKSAEDNIIEAIADDIDKSQTYNPLLIALRENDKKNLFRTNVTTAFHKTGFHLFDYYFGSVINIHDATGKIIKQEGRVGQAAGTFNLIIGNTGSGKAQPISTPIPTPNGWTTMGALKIGDKVFGANGEEIEVLGIFPQGKKDIYKITFSDGRTAMSTEDHLWRITTRVSTDHTNFEVKTLKEIKEDYVSDYKMLSVSKTGEDKTIRGYKYKIQTLAGPVQYSKKEVKMYPYSFGILLSTGCVIDDKLIIKSDNRHLMEVFARANGYVLNEADSTNKLWEFINPYTAQRVLSNDVMESVGVNLFNNHKSEFMIPDDYMYNDFETRLELLQGLMDGSTTLSGVINGHIVFNAASKKLCQQVEELIRSLGFGAKIIYTENGLNIFVSPATQKQIIRDNVATLVAESSSVDLLSRNEIGDKFISITNIEFDHQEEAQCILVSAEDHLYVTDQFIVTHNTTLGAQIAANIIRQYKYANVIHFDCENRFDVSRCETITQLPASFFDVEKGERYMIRTGMVGLDVIQEMIVKTYVKKMQLKKELTVPSGFKDEFGKDVMILEPTVILIDSITTVLNETFNPDNQKEASDAEKMRGNTEGARDAKTLKGFFKDILPLCKEANIIIYGINHINQNMSMNAFVPVTRQQNYLKQDESIPGGKTMLYYPFNIIKLTAKPSDDFTEESDGFAGHMVMIEPIKSSSNQSGNNSKGVSFEMVFTHKYGFDPLRTMILYGREQGLIEGNKTRMKFKGDDSFTFSLKNLNQEKNEKPIWESVKKFIIPTLDKHLSFIEPNETEFDNRSLDY